MRLMVPFTILNLIKWDVGCCAILFLYSLFFCALYADYSTMSTQDPNDDEDQGIADDPGLTNGPEKTKGSHKAASAQILAGGYTKGLDLSLTLNLATHCRFFKE